MEASSFSRRLPLRERAASSNDRLVHYAFQSVDSSTKANEKLTSNPGKMIRFVATEAGALTENGVLSCGASNSKSEDEYHYVNIQAHLDGPDPDGWGVYFEIDDQANGGYERLEQVRLSGSQIVLTLKQGTRWYPDLEEIVVDLGVVSEQEANDLVDSIETCIEQSSLVIEREDSA